MVQAFKRYEQSKLSHQLLETLVGASHLVLAPNAPLLEQGIGAGVFYEQTLLLAHCGLGVVSPINGR